MAFDTVIDKAQLEAAMKATADAIREKTGDTADCTWDPAQGFAALIAAIESGGSSGAGTNYGSITSSGYNSTIAFGTEIPEDNFFVVAVATVVPSEKHPNLFIAMQYTKINGVESASFVNSYMNVVSVIPSFDRTANTMMCFNGVSTMYLGPAGEYVWFMGALV